jgi:hypothetical protein
MMTSEFVTGEFGGGGITMQKGKEVLYRNKIEESTLQLLSSLHNVFFRCLPSVAFL